MRDAVDRRRRRETQPWPSRARIGWRWANGSAGCSPGAPAPGGSHTATCCGPGSCCRRRRRSERGDRPPAGDLLRHGAQVAGAVLCRGVGRAGRSAPPRPQTHLSRHGRGRGQGAGLRAAGRTRRAPVSMECRGAGRRGRGPRPGERDLAVHGRPLAGRRRAPPGASVLDLSPGPGLRRPGRSRSGPLRPDLGGPAAR